MSFSVVSTYKFHSTIGNYFLKSTDALPFPDRNCVLLMQGAQEYFGINKYSRGARGKPKAGCMHTYPFELCFFKNVFLNTKSYEQEKYQANLDKKLVFVYLQEAFHKSHLYWITLYWITSYLYISVVKLKTIVKSNQSRFWSHISFKTMGYQI